MSIQLPDSPLGGVPGPIDLDLLAPVRPEAVRPDRGVAAEHSAITATDSLSRDSGDTLGILRLVSDVARLSGDPAEPSPPDPHHRPGPAPGELEEIPDVEYDASMWTDAEHEGFGAPDRRAP